MHVITQSCVLFLWMHLLTFVESQALQCPVIRVLSNVQVTGDVEQANFGNVVQFSCKNNSEVLYGPAEIYCDENGEWNRQPPTCEEIKCFAPVISNGRVLGDITEYKENDILNFECNIGFQKSDVRSPVCLKQGMRAEWSPTPMCEQVTCTAYDPHVGNWHTHRYFNITLNDTVGYGCQYGYKKPPGVHQATCTRQGWSPNPLCEVTTCNRYDVPNADIVSVIKPVYVFNEEVQYVCKEGYDGRFTLQCLDNQWLGNHYCPEKGCERLDIPHAIITSNPRSTYHPGESVQYTCVGYHEKVITLTCGHGKWNGPQSCSG